MDSGSPISLIKESFVPLEARLPICENDEEFCGINGSRLEVIDIFNCKVKIENIDFQLKFYIVQNQTMAFMALLGRDFSSQPSITVTLGDRVIITKITRHDVSLTQEFNCEAKQIMNIEPNIDSLKISDKLQINQKIDHQVVQEIECLYSDYLQVKNYGLNTIDFEMKIALNHNQPISFRPRRLSYSDKDKLQLIINECFSA